MEQLSASVGRTEALSLMYENQMKLYWNSVSLLMRVVLFYMALLGASIGYVLTQNLQPPIPRMLLVGGVLISIFFFVTYIAWNVGLFQVIDQLKVLSQAINPGVYEEMYLDKMYRRWKILLTICTISGTCILGAVWYGMFVLLEMVG